MKLSAKTAVLSIFCLIGIGVNAQNSGTFGENVTWTYDPLTYTLTFSGSGEIPFFSSNQAPWNDKDFKVLVIGDGITKIGSSAFYNCVSLETVTFAEGSKLTSIGNFAFQGCTSLASATLPSGLTSIGQESFRGCSSLSSVTLPDGLTTIREKSFYGCGLTSVTIPASVKTIEPNAFEVCSELQTVIFEDGISLDSLGGSVFSECSKLTAVTLPNNLTSISSGMFNKCSSLASVTFPASLISLGNQSFYFCTALKSITLPSALKTIGNSSFQSCTALESVTIPASVETIGNAAFNKCSNLTDVFVSWDVPLEIKADDKPFLNSNNANLSLYLPKGKTDAYKEKGWDFKQLNSKNVEGFANFVEPNVLYKDNSGRLHGFEINLGNTLPISDAVQSITSSEEVNGVDINYTRTFSSTSVWQAWYMPFEAVYNETLAGQCDVAQILGVFMDAAGNSYITFQPIASGTTIKANTPYVVRSKTAGEVILTLTGTNLKQTQDTTFTIQSATQNFTFGGVYEKTVNDTIDWYAINTEGNFQKLDSGVYLNPMRIWMTVTDRDDNPYAISTSTPQQVRIRVLGDDTTGIGFIDETDAQQNIIYNLQGQQVGEGSKGIVIINGKKYLR